MQLCKAHFYDYKFCDLRNKCCYIQIVSGEKKRDSVFDTGSRLRSAWFGDRVSVGAKIFSLLQIANRLCGPCNLIINGYRFFPLEEFQRPVVDTNARFRMGGARTILPLYVSCHVTDNFTPTPLYYRKSMSNIFTVCYYTVLRKSNHL